MSSGHISTLYPWVVCDTQLKSMAELKEHQTNVCRTVSASMQSNPIQYFI